MPNRCILRHGTCNWKNYVNSYPHLWTLSGIVICCDTTSCFCCSFIPFHVFICSWWWFLSGSDCRKKHLALLCHVLVRKLRLLREKDLMPCHVYFVELPRVRSRECAFVMCKWKSYIDIFSLSFVNLKSPHTFWHQLQCSGHLFPNPWRATSVIFNTEFPHSVSFNIWPCLEVVFMEYSHVSFSLSTWCICLELNQIRHICSLAPCTMISLLP